MIFDFIMAPILLMCLVNEITFGDISTFKSKIIIIFMLGGLISTGMDITQYIEGNKKKKILENVLSKIAKNYYERKYGEEINIHHIKVDSYKGHSGIFYSNSGYVYLDKEETKHIYIGLIYKKSEGYHTREIYDNVQDDNIIEDVTTLINEKLEEFDVELYVELNKARVIFNQKTYKNNLKDYLTCNKIKLNLTIIKKIKNQSEMDNVFDYYEVFSKEISSILRNNLKNVAIGIIFLDNELPDEVEENDLLHEYSRVCYLMDWMVIPHTEIKTADYAYIYF